MQYRIYGFYAAIMDFLWRFQALLLSGTMFPATQRLLLLFTGFLCAPA